MKHPNETPEKAGACRPTPPPFPPPPPCRPPLDILSREEKVSFLEGKAVGLVQAVEALTCLMKDDPGEVPPALTEFVINTLKQAQASICEARELKKGA